MNCSVNLIMSWWWFTPYDAASRLDVLATDLLVLRFFAKGRRVVDAG